MRMSSIHFHYLPSNHMESYRMEGNNKKRDPINRLFRHIIGYVIGFLLLCQPQSRWSIWNTNNCVWVCDPSSIHASIINLIHTCNNEKSTLIRRCLERGVEWAPSLVSCSFSESRNLCCWFDDAAEAAVAVIVVDGGSTGMKIKQRKKWDESQEDNATN